MLNCLIDAGKYFILDNTYLLVFLMIAFVHIIEIPFLLDIRAHVFPALAPNEFLQLGVLGIVAYDVKILVQFGLALYKTILLIIGILVPLIDIPPVNKFPVIERIFQDLLEARFAPLPAPHGYKPLFIQQVAEFIETVSTTVVFIKDVSEDIFRGFIDHKPLVLMVILVAIGTASRIDPPLHFILVNSPDVMADLVRQVLGHCLLDTDHELLIMGRVHVD